MSTYGPYPGVVVSIHDGDTFRVRIATPRHRRPTDIGWDVTVAGLAAVLVDVRLYGCNAAELATDQGKAALAYLLNLMPVGTAVQLTSYGWDKYAGRSDCAITLPDGRDLTEVLIAAGQAAPYSGHGPKPVPTLEKR